MNAADRERLEACYRDLIEFYFVIKQVVIAAERDDKERRLSFSAINELRSALDHIMRAHGVVHGTSNADAAVSESGLTVYDYCTKNLSKAKGHLYRAGFDAYDIIGINTSLELDA